MTDNVIDFRAWAEARSRRRHPSTYTPDAPPSRIDDHSPASLWRADFAVHAGQHADVSTSGMWVLAPAIERALQTSLPVFQVGEIGTGQHLLDSACGVVGEDHLQALRSFVIENQEHARILALVCAALDIEMLDDHWTERLFRRGRYLRGFRVEMLMIVIAQLITAQVYEVLAHGVGDPTLSRIFARLHADELRHLEFHAATLPEHIESLPRSARNAVPPLWHIAAAAALVSVTWEHRRLLRANACPAHFFLTDTWRTIRAQGKRFFRSED